MNLENLWAEVEGDQEWRTAEIRFFQNQCSNVPGVENQDQFRRAIVLLLYAHFEGFCKFAFSLYVNSINGESIKCGHANFAIAAASLADLFKELRNPSSKSDLFRNALPDDTKLHQFSRELDFVKHSNHFEDKLVNIPDSLIDTESNLKPVVLRKILFRLGFPHDQFKEIEGAVDKLLNFRNRIAHGEMKDGIKLETYDQLREATFSIMNEVKSSIMKALNDRVYLRAV